MLTYLEFMHVIWFKALICTLSSFLICFFSIKKYLVFIQKKALFQPIRSDGPESHLKTKKNTPTMGGIFIILAAMATTLLFIDIKNRYIIVALVITAVFSLIGLTDDLLKVIFKNPKGFRGSYKLIIQFLAISLCYFWLGSIDEIHNSGKIFLPIGAGHYITVGLAIYAIFVNIVIVGTSNATNLTDGLDGLVSVPSIIGFSCLALIIYVASSPEFAARTNTPLVKFSGELVFLCLSFIGAIAAFLTFNHKPAKIFMGDVGSLGIGAALGIIAVIIKQEFIFFVIALLFVAEALSVILQVASFKIRKKRIFLMAPLHHHFEKLGWSETKVVQSFWLASLFFAAVGLIIFFA